MSIDTLTCPCFVVTCDRCDEPLPLAEDGSYAHYESEQEALEAARDADWYIAGSALVCLSCVEEATFYEVACPACGAKAEESCTSAAPLFCEERIDALVQRVADKPVE